MLCAGIADDELLQYLDDAGLADLYKRAGGFDCPVTWNWYDVMSQQVFSVNYGCFSGSYTKLWVFRFFDEFYDVIQT